MENVLLPKLYTLLVPYSYFEAGDPDSFQFSFKAFK